LESSIGINGAFCLIKKKKKEREERRRELPGRVQLASTVHGLINELSVELLTYGFYM
jgi:hypothetical protein